MNLENDMVETIIKWQNIKWITDQRDIERKKKSQKQTWERKKLK